MIQLKMILTYNFIFLEKNMIYLIFQKLDESVILVEKTNFSQDIQLSIWSRCWSSFGQPTSVHMY